MSTYIFISSFRNRTKSSIYSLVIFGTDFGRLGTKYNLELYNILLHCDTVCTQYIQHINQFLRLYYTYVYKCEIPKEEK